MTRAIAQGILIGIVILIAWYSIRYAGQPHYGTPTVFYPHNHDPGHVTHPIRWITRRWGH